MDRPLSKPFCQALGAIFGQHDPLVPDGSDPNDVISEWAGSLKESAETILRVIQKIRGAQTFHELMAARMLKDSYYCVPEETVGELSISEVDAFFERTIKSLETGLRLLAMVGERVSGQAVLIKLISKGMVVATTPKGRKTFSRLADDVFTLAYDQIRLNRRARSLPRELAEFLGAASNLVGIPTDDEQLIEEARRFCREKLGKKT